MTLGDGLIMIDVLFVNLPIQWYYQKDTAVFNDFNPSLGLLCLATALEANGRNAHICDLTHEKIGKTEFIKLIKEKEPKIVAISAYTENIDMALHFAAVIKKEFPKINIAIGGPHASLSQEFFYESTNVDFLLIGEGEATILELVEALDSEEKVLKYADIPGLWYWKDGNVHENEKRDFIIDLDLYPIPKREYFSLDNYAKNANINIYTSRGCPNRCIYCSASALSGSKYRVRSIDNVFLEMILVTKLIGEKNFFIVDDSFTVLKNRVYRFIELIKQYNPKFYWNCESIANVMNEELLKLMSEARCTAIQYGIESGNKEVQKKIKKNVNLEHAEEIIYKTAEYGMMPCASFIIGHYCDTEETVRDTLNMMKRLKNNTDVEIAAGFNTPFPGTYQYENRDELGIRMKVTNYKSFDLLTPIIETDNFTVDDQRNWLYEVRNIVYAKGNYFKEMKKEKMKANFNRDEEKAT